MKFTKLFIRHLRGVLAIDSKQVCSWCGSSGSDISIGGGVSPDSVEVVWVRSVSIAIATIAMMSIAIWVVTELIGECEWEESVESTEDITG